MKCMNQVFILIIIIITRISEREQHTKIELKIKEERTTTP